MSEQHASHVHDAAPSAWVVRFAPLVSGGRTRPRRRVGRGRHARLFASRGCRVVAIDRDAEALSALRDVGLVQTLTTDLESEPWPADIGTFDAIVVTNYLHRALFPSLLAALADDGAFIYETFAQGNARYGKPSNPDYLLTAGELLAEIGATLTVVAFEQGVQEGARPAVIQRIAAVGPARAWPPPLS